MEEYVQVPVPKQFVSHVYALLAQLTGDASADSSPPSAQLASTRNTDLRYQLLAGALERIGSDLLRLTMEQIEQICGGRLPDSAYKHRAWWANTDSHSHAQSWRRAGYQVAKVEFDRQKQISAVTFRRV